MNDLDRLERLLIKAGRSRGGRTPKQLTALLRINAEQLIDTAREAQLHRSTCANSLCTLCGAVEPLLRDIP